MGVSIINSNYSYNKVLYFQTFSNNTCQMQKPIKYTLTAISQKKTRIPHLVWVTTLKLGKCSCSLQPRKQGAGSKDWEETPQN